MKRGTLDAKAMQLDLNQHKNDVLITSNIFTLFTACLSQLLYVDVVIQGTMMSSSKGYRRSILQPARL